jgi:hypothetical protein
VTLDPHVVILPGPEGSRIASRDGSLIAASRPLQGTRLDDPSRQRVDWQNEAWSFYDGPDGEALKFGVNWMANLLSQARLRAARIITGDTEPEVLDDGPAADAVEELAGGIGGQSQLLWSFTVQLSVPGLGYLVGSEGLADLTHLGSNWGVISSDVIRLKSPATPVSAPVYELQYDEGQWAILPPDQTMVVKFWRPHPRWFWRPDSPAHAAIGPLRELRRINQYIDATLVSRVAGAGLLVFPQEATFPTAPAPTPGSPNSGQHPFVTEVMQVMMRAVQNPGTAEQIVPIPVEVPAEHVDKFKLLNWSTDLSDRSLDMRISAQRRVATALDIPAEIILGMGDTSHWNAWQIEESAISVHARPMLELLTADLTRGYLHPVLEAQGVDTEGIVIWADTSDLVVRPDKTKHTLDLYDRGEIGGDSVRRTLGFAESDMPTDEELASWAYKKLLSNAQLAPAAMEGLGLKLEVIDPVSESPAPSGNGEEADPADENPDEGPPDTFDDPDEESAPENLSLDPRLLVLEGHVKRALEVGRNRLKGGSRTDPLDGVFSHALSTLGEVGYDPVLTVRYLGQYCRVLLDTETEYDRASLQRLLTGEVDCAEC